MTVYATRDEYGDDESTVWTISKEPNNTGWETDSGCNGYGLSKETAEYYVKCINEHGALLSKLETAINEFNKIEQLTSTSPNINEMIIHQKAREALKQIRE